MTKNEVEVQIKEKLIELTNNKGIETNMTLAELGIDSLNVIEVILLLETLSGDEVDLDDIEIDEFTTVDDLIDIVALDESE